MKKEINTMHDEQQYDTNAVIDRGYNIYDDWANSNLSSRKIVSYVEKAVASLNFQKTKSAYVEALSCLFALDLRIKERYNGILKCLLHYFAWRRETRTLKRIKLKFNISENMDIRTAIEIKIQNIRESLAEVLLNSDDNKNGGKQSGTNKNDTAQPENAQGEQPLEDTKNQGSEISENEQKLLDERINNSLTENNVEQTAESLDTLSTIQENEQPTYDESVSAENLHENIAKNNNENTATENNSETITDKPNVARTYNDAIDSPPLPNFNIFNSDSSHDDLTEEIIIEESTSNTNEKKAQDSSNNVKSKEENHINLNNNNNKNEPKLNNDSKQDRDRNPEHDSNQNHEPEGETKEESNGEKRGNLDGEKNNGKQQSNKNNLPKDTTKTNSTEKSTVNPPPKTAQNNMANNAENTARTHITKNLTEKDIMQAYEKMTAAIREQISVDSANIDTTAVINAQNPILESKFETRVVNTSKIK